MMKNIFVPLLGMLFIMIFSPLIARESWQTYYEQHNRNQTPSYSETIDFSKRLAEQSPMLQYEVFGQTRQGRDLAVLVFDKNGRFTPEAVKESGNTILLLQAAIHPGEPVGKDAGLQLMRDIAIHGKHLPYLENITILFIPILNADGHERFGPYNRINQNGPEEMGWRTNARNLNLNRDYLKADAQEMRHFLELWHLWEPDFFIDTHSTNGGDYQYAMTYALDIFGNANKDLVNWIEKDYLPQVENAMEQDNYPIFPYVTYRSWHDPRSGLRSFAGHPAFSNHYASELNRPGLLLETHMLKPYHMRVESTYLMIVNTLEILHKDKNLKNVIEKADQHTASAAFRDEKFPLRYEITGDSVMVDFLGVEYDIKESTLSGGDWFIYKPEKPATFQVPWFNQSRVTYSVELPEAYIIPVEYFDVIERLKYHGVEMMELKEDKTLSVQSYRFKDVSLAARSNEGRQTASFTIQTLEEDRVYYKGSVIVPMSQPRARIIAHALEPMAPGSYAYWGFFNAIFERIEYFESYAMERIAREMIANDPSLMQGLEKALKDNPSMADNPYAILSWFYEKTPYYDQKHNVYPVGRIMDEIFRDQL